MSVGNIHEQLWRKCIDILSQPDVSELEINGPREFFIKRAGKREKLNVILDSDESYLDFFESCIVPETDSRDFYTRGSFLYEGRIRHTGPQGTFQARCHAVLPPACEVPQVTIAKKSQSLKSLETIAARGTMAKEMKDFIEACVRANLTIVISGGTGSGKTTMLESLTTFFTPTDRIGVAEDTPELNLEQDNVTYLHSIPFRPGGNQGAVELSWVVQQFQRMRTDKLIIGETRGKEFADFLIAANSGMEGSLTTIHANNPNQALQKMTNFALKGSERQPIRSINTDIANSIDIVIQLGIFPDAGHKVTAIQEISSTVGNGEDARVATQELYRYDSIRKMFLKGVPMTDKLREKMMKASIDYDRFLGTLPGTQLKDEFANLGANNPFTGRPGMPERTRSI